ncbi:hypothetical protein BLOT_006975 [Blomia tropicalis]|nr:hypothetical protein BLOT_006975 [Blomia tropicalis]
MPPIIHPFDGDASTLIGNSTFCQLYSLKSCRSVHDRMEKVCVIGSTRELRAILNSGQFALVAFLKQTTANKKNEMMPM